MKVINIKKEKLFPKIFHFRQNRNQVEKSVIANQNPFWENENSLKKFEKYILQLIMLTFLRLINK